MNSAANVNGDTRNHIYGAKYEATKGLDRVELAKLIRADIAKAVECGALPAIKVSVRAVRVTHSSGINVAITGIPEGFVVRVSELEEERQRTAKMAQPWLSREAHYVLTVLERLVEQYNFDRCELQSDYFHVRFYSQIGFAVKNPGEKAA
ncbi:MAG TPA: hypothetical protein VG734_26060 [Lacunisphaera sp.]|nr:hypothetical protein [Lacunisphaera sp.]